MRHYKRRRGGWVGPTAIVLFVGALIVLTLPFFTPIPFNSVIVFPALLAGAALIITGLIIHRSER